MLRQILNWSDRKLETAANDENGARGCAKAVGLGVLEGTLDSLTFLGALCVVTSIVGACIGKTKK